MSGSHALVDPLNRNTGYSYDGVGNLLIKIDPKSQTTNYKYDVANQLKGITYSDGTTPSISGLQYDGDGNRLSVSDGTGTSSYSFDSLNRLTQSKDGAGATVGYGYDLNGNLTSLTYPGNHQVSRTFDQDSRMASVSDWLGNTEKFAYDPNSNLTDTTFPASTKEVDTQAFDNADNLISIVDAKNNSKRSNSGDGNSGNQQALASFFYTRDGNNQVTSESSSPSSGQGDGHSSGDNSGGGSKTYSYTPLSQLKNVNGNSYSYDTADNLVKLITGTAQSFDAANQLTSSTTQSAGQNQHGDRSVQSGDHSVTTKFSYDQNGNRVSATFANGAVTYGFDQANRLTGLGSVANYSYNGIGLRETKTTGNQTLHFTWGMVGASQPLLSDSQNYYVYGPGDLPLEQILVSGDVSFFHHDQLGSTRSLTDNQGTTKATFAFDPYGNLSEVSGKATTPMLFAGQFMDNESGLYYLRARYYDSATGQFLSLDPLVGITKSPYGYAGGNPLNGTDPSGLGFNPATGPGPRYGPTIAKYPDGYQCNGGLLFFVVQVWEQLSNGQWVRLPDELIYTGKTCPAPGLPPRPSPTPSPSAEPGTESVPSWVGVGGLGNQGNGGAWNPGNGGWGNPGLPGTFNGWTTTIALGYKQPGRQPACPPQVL